MTVRKGTDVSGKYEETKSKFQEEMQLGKDCCLHWRSRRAPGSPRVKLNTGEALAHSLWVCRDLSSALPCWWVGMEPGGMPALPAASGDALGLEEPPGSFRRDTEPTKDTATPRG